MCDFNHGDHKICIRTVFHAHSTISWPSGIFTKTAMAITVQEKVYSSAHTLGYVANNSVILYNAGNSKIYDGRFQALQQWLSILGNKHGIHEQKNSIEV